MTTFKRYSLRALLVFAALFAAPGFAQEPSAQQLAQMQSFLSIMDSYYDIIEATHEIAADNEKAAILKMAKIQEVYEERGHKAKAADVFRKVLQDSKNPTVRNAAYAMLADNLKDTGRTAEALEALTEGLSENIKALE